jgi:DNA segregation ATPase FtsK/SpoIIIE, S-DNA-T family
VTNGRVANLRYIQPPGNLQPPLHVYEWKRILRRVKARRGRPNSKKADFYTGEVTALDGTILVVTSVVKHVSTVMSDFADYQDGRNIIRPIEEIANGCDLDRVTVMSAIDTLCAIGMLWAGLGVLKAGWVQVNWWWLTEQAYLRSQAVRDNDPRTWESLHKHARKVRLVRGSVLAAEVVALLVLIDTVTAYAPLAWVPIGLVVLPLLAWFGRPDDKPILTSATVPVAFESLSLEVVIRALEGLGVGRINQALAKDRATAVVLIDPIQRDGPGWLARLDLPHGVTAGEVSERRESLASGLRRQLGCVWPETIHKRHPGALALFVGDEDMTTAEQPAWPLAKRGTADIFGPVVFATDPRGRLVTVTLMFASVIIGSIPRMGKTFLLRLLLLICALDIRTEIHAFDLKGTGDLKPVTQVAHAYRAGEEPEDLEYLLADLRKLRVELRRRARVIRDLDERRCPENKVTPELASDLRLGLHPVVIALDECQVAFEHEQYGKELEAICTDFVKRGPALGMLLLLATQRPDAKSIPTGISANAVLRMCLKVMGQVENDMVLGTSMYKNGIRATMFAREDKGVFYFAGEGLSPVIVRGYGFDLPSSKAIGARARMMREAAGRLTGYALGEEADVEVRSIAEDVLLAFREDPKLYLTTIADRLRESLPGAYADITPEAVRSQLAGLGATSKRVREPGGAPLAGFEKSAIIPLLGTPDV